MRKIVFLFSGIVAISLIFSALAVDEKQPIPDGSKSNIEKLIDQVDSLQAKIKTLEDRLAKLEKERIIKLVTSPPVAGTAPNALPIPSAVTDPNRPPIAWGEREFNGLKYYLVPLGAEGH